MTETERRKGYFDLEDMPVYAGRDAERPEPYCCEYDGCSQRAYSQAMIITLERLAQAFAGLQLLGWTTSSLWNCHDPQRHDDDCQHEACEFARDQQAKLNLVEMRLATTVKELFTALTEPAADLSAEWQAFFDVEQAGEALEQTKQAMRRREIGLRECGKRIRVSLELWRQEAVEDTYDYRDWLPTPGVGRVGPP
jgi:hypothetical protein